MKPKEISKLKYRRQYIVAPHDIECPLYFNKKQLTKNCFLYFHVDLRITDYHERDVSLVLLGEIFDYRIPTKQNKDILKDLAISNLDAFSKKLAECAGRYVIIYLLKQEIYFFHDATSSRKVYYASTDRGNWCASHPQMLANFLNLNKTKNESKLRFYNSREYIRLNNSNIGNQTIYDEVLQLLPNHYLDFKDLSVVRYWPIKPIERLPLKEVAARSAEMIKGYMTAFNERFDLMVPLTAGKDSRIIMAATKEFKDDVYYYINREKRLTDKDNDLVVPAEIAKQLCFDFHILDPYIQIDKNFKRMYYENNENASEKFLPIINNYHVNFSEKVNVPGLLPASAFEMYGFFDKKINPWILARLNWVEKYEFAVEYYTQWLASSSKIAEQNNLSILSLFYWEERLPNWGSQIQMEKDIAQEDLSPYDSRQLNEYMFSVPKKYIGKPGFVLFKEILKILWPEALEFPINPGFKKSVKLLFRKLRILNAINETRFKVHHWKYRPRWYNSLKDRKKHTPEFNYNS